MLQKIPHGFWSHHILPLVYDESLSYYECLSKMAKYIDNTIDELNEQEVDIQNLKDGMNEINTEMAEFKVELDRLNNEIKDIQEEYLTKAEFNVELDRLNNEIKDIQEEYLTKAEFNDELDRLNNEFNSKIETINTEFTDVYNKITDISNKLNQITTDVQNIKNDYLSKSQGGNVEKLTRFTGGLRATTPITFDAQSNDKSSMIKINGDKGSAYIGAHRGEIMLDSDATDTPRITHVGDPINNTDASNKIYTDNQIASQATNTLNSSKIYTDEQVSKQADITLTSAKEYTNSKLGEITGEIQKIIETPLIGYINKDSYSTIEDSIKIYYILNGKHIILQCAIPMLTSDIVDDMTVGFKLDDEISSAVNVGDFIFVEYYDSKIAGVSSLHVNSVLGKIENVNTPQGDAKALFWKVDTNIDTNKTFIFKINSLISNAND